MRLALVVEYDGTDYRGFQYQVSGPTIQEELEKAISRFTGESVRLKAAGRTDAGVHAKRQYVAFDTRSAHSLGTVVRALNAHLPADIAVKAAYIAGQNFDPRRDARGRTYRYMIQNSSTPSPLLRRTTYHVTRPLRVGPMRRGARLFVGRHDFAGFAGPLDDPTGSTVREIFEARIGRSGEMITFDVEGNAFLPHQVRRMAGALVDLGIGRLSHRDLRSMVDATQGAPNARALPPQGLCLVDVAYSEFPLEGSDSHGNVPQAT